MLPLFPISLNLWLLIEDSPYADTFFWTYSIAIMGSTATDFGIRFISYRSTRVSIRDVLPLKTALSIISTAVVIVLSYTFNSTLENWCLFILLATPFLASADPATHYLRARGKQYQLFLYSLLSWLISTALVLVFPSAALVTDFALLILYANVSRFMISNWYCKFRISSYLHKPKASSVRSIQLWEGASVALNFFRIRGIAVFYGIIHGEESLAKVGILLAVAQKLSELGVALYESGMRRQELSRSVPKPSWPFSLTFLGFALAVVYGAVELSGSYALIGILCGLFLICSFLSHLLRLGLYEARSSDSAVIAGIGYVSIGTFAILLLHPGAASYISAVTLSEIVYLLILHHRYHRK